MYSVQMSICKITHKYWEIIWGFIENYVHLKPENKSKPIKLKDLLLVVNSSCVYDQKDNFQQVYDILFFILNCLALAAAGIAFNKALEEYNSLPWKFVSYFQAYGINYILCIALVYVVDLLIFYNGTISFLRINYPNQKLRILFSEY